MKKKIRKKKCEQKNEKNTRREKADEECKCTVKGMVPLILRRRAKINEKLPYRTVPYRQGKK